MWGKLAVFDDIKLDWIAREGGPNSKRQHVEEEFGGGASIEFFE